MASDKKDQDSDEHSELATDYFDHGKYIQSKITIRPLVVVGSSTIFSLTNFCYKATLTEYAKTHRDTLDLDGPYLLAPSQFAQLFNRRQYDVRVFPSEYSGSPFHTRNLLVSRQMQKSKDGKAMPRTGIIHLCLYKPGVPAELVLVLDKEYKTAEEFRTYLYDFLIATDIIINKPSGHHYEKLSTLDYVKFGAEIKSIRKRQSFAGPYTSVQKKRRTTNLWSDDWPLL